MNIIQETKGTGFAGIKNADIRKNDLLIFYKSWDIILLRNKKCGYPQKLLEVLNND